MQPIEVGVIGTGWCGGIRARTATEDWHAISRHSAVSAVYISATPESTHFPMARECLAAGKHVFLEKPIAMTLAEADELVELARRGKLKCSIGYSQRFNPKYVYVKRCVNDDTIGLMANKRYRAMVARCS